MQDHRTGAGGHEPPELTAAQRASLEALRDQVGVTLACFPDGPWHAGLTRTHRALTKALQLPLLELAPMAADEDGGKL